MEVILKMIDYIPQIIEYIVPGLIFMLVYRRMAPYTNRIADSMFYISAIVISTVVESGVFLVFDALKKQPSRQCTVIVSCIICCVAAFICARLKTVTRFKNFVRDYFVKSSDDNIWTSLADFSNGTYIRMTMKSGATIDGYLEEIEEKGNDSWLALYNYDYVYGDSTESGTDLPDVVKDSYILVRVADVDHATYFIPQPKSYRPSEPKGDGQT